MKTAFEIAMAKDTGYIPDTQQQQPVLSRKQLLAIIRGSTPPWEHIHAWANRGIGTFSDLRGWHWENLDKKTDEQLLELYHELGY